MPNLTVLGCSKTPADPPITAGGLSRFAWEDTTINASKFRFRRSAPLGLALVAAGGLAASACGGAVTPKATADTLHRPGAVVADPTTPAPVYPLLGTPVTDPAHAARPALSVKIDNAPGSFPQAGLDKADIVTEALVEGGLTRLFATFQSQDAGLVGPIRSARPVDAALLKELGCGIFAYSGAATGEIAPTKAVCPASTRVTPEDGAGGFDLVSWRTSPHSTFSSTASLYADGKSQGVSWTPPPQLFSYSPAPQGGTANPVHSAYMDLSTISPAQWTWRAGANNWGRDQNGAPDYNSDGSRITADNVVILSVGVGPTGIFDQAGNQDPYVLLVGSGTAWVLRNGKEVQGTWTRPSIDVPMTLTSTDGTMTLAPGTTWLELLPHPHLPRLTP
jgi:hypothetical protein